VGRRTHSKAQEKPREYPTCSSASRQRPFARIARRFASAKSLAVLQRIQPEHGGFLEAAPLTSFVALSLSAAGCEQDPVLRKAIQFLHASARPDGSWPIYGTSRVLIALNQVQPGWTMAQRGVDWLLTAQNEDDGWGGDRGVLSSIEETSLAIAALSGRGEELARAAASRASRKLLDWIADGGQCPPSPIGL